MLKLLNGLGGAQAPIRYLLARPVRQSAHLLPPGEIVRLDPRAQAAGCVYFADSIVVPSDRRAGAKDLWISVKPAPIWISLAHSVFVQFWIILHRNTSWCQQTRRRCPPPDVRLLISSPA
ncbi:Hypothetical predicted protein [Cloeon dipterum]|uniref:Uncharacterized protein n=1 Tax=Cloeon dipterum TaxID=197152 RepID=A0A8S1DBS2_9INSE|nr:Hypothetical predicted protein [Cloeon dipterum]